MTLKELRELDHDIYALFKEEIRRVVVEGNARYLLTNNFVYNGSKPSKKYDYRYGWWLCDRNNSDGQRLHRYLKPVKRRPL